MIILLNRNKFSLLKLTNESKEKQHSEEPSVLDTLLKKAHRHHIIIIADMIFAGFYIYFVKSLIPIIKDVPLYIAVSTLVCYAVFFLTIQYILFKQITYDKSITKLIDRGELGESEELERKQQ